MKKRFTLAVLAAGLTLFGAGTAVAQDLPDVPGIDPARDQVSRQGTTARAPRLPATNVLPSEARAGLSRGVGGKATGKASPSRLPETGVDTTALALDGLTLLGAGTVLLAVRRRFVAVR